MTRQRLIQTARHDDSYWRGDSPLGNYHPESIRYAHANFSDSSEPEVIALTPRLESSLPQRRTKAEHSDGRHDGGREEWT